MTTETEPTENSVNLAKPPRPGRGKKREKKRASIPKILLFLGMVLLVGLIAARVVIHFMLRPDAIVERLERELNLRAQVEDTSLSLLSFPAKLELKGLVLAPRDDSADKASPLDGRPELSKSVLTIESLVLEQGLFDLLFGNLDVQKLRGEKFKLEIVMEEDGSHTLEGMFDKPKIVAAKPNPKYDGEDKDDDKKDPKSKKKKKKKSKGLRVDSLPLNTSLKEFGLSNGEIIIHMKKKSSKLHFRNVELSLADVVIDREDLSKGNKGQMEMSSNLTIQKDDESETYSQLDVKVAGDVEFFEAASGKFNPTIDADLTLHKGSSIDNIPTLEKLYQKLEPLSSFGIHLREVELEGMVQEDAVARIHYFENELVIKDKPRLDMSDYTLDIYEGAWMRMDQNTHSVESEVRLSQAHTQTTLEGVFKFLGSTIGKLLPDGAKERAKAYLLHDDHLAIVFTSTKALSRPTVKVVKPDGDDLIKASGLNELIDGIKNLLKDEDLKDALKDLFK